MCPTCPVVRLGDLDATPGGREETAGLPHEMPTPTARVRWSDFVANVTISESTGIFDIGDVIAGRRHSIFWPYQETPSRRSSPHGS